MLTGTRTALVELDLIVLRVEKRLRVASVVRARPSDCQPVTVRVVAVVDEFKAVIAVGGTIRRVGKLDLRGYVPFQVPDLDPRERIIVRKALGPVVPSVGAGRRDRECVHADHRAIAGRPSGDSEAMVRITIEMETGAVGCRQVL
jgi:hypothetical protein